MRKIGTSGFDLTGNSFLRAIKLGLFNKLIPLGNFGRGPGIRPALILLMLHWVGGPLFRVAVRYERYLHRLYQIVRK